MAGRPAVPGDAGWNGFRQHSRTARLWLAAGAGLAGDLGGPDGGDHGPDLLLRSRERRCARRRSGSEPMNYAALAIIFLAAALALALGLIARRGQQMTLEQWTVGGRGFGGLLVFLLTAGEIYTTFTFLGGSGWAYGKGAPAYYILVYGSLAYILSYWLLPPIWRYARQERVVSQPHYFARKYDSPMLGVLAAAVGVVALIPYLMLQFKGLGIIVSIASYGAISSRL